jgi:hypothetical protein
MLISLSLVAFSNQNLLALDNGDAAKNAANANTTSAAITEEYSPQVLISGKWGSGQGEFGLGASMGEEGDDVIPKELAQDDSGNIYVLDSWNNRIQKFDANGKYLEEIPISAYVRPTAKEFKQAATSWNKKKEGFIKAVASRMVWLNGQLIVQQKQVSDISSGKHSQKVLALKSGKFTETSENVRKGYEGRLSSDIVDAKGSKYVQNDDKWQKINKDGKTVFEFKIRTEHKYGQSKLGFMSVVDFDKKGDCFLEMRPFSNNENDWGRVFLHNGGGMQIAKWCKR